MLRLFVDIWISVVAVFTELVVYVNPAATNALVSMTPGAHFTNMV